jgi:Ca2+:H+ antiporter
MANGEERHRPSGEDEAVPLLAADNERSTSPNKNIKSLLWLERLLHYDHAARARALKFISNVPWVFVPLGLAAGVFQWNPVLVSVFNFVAIIPLSAAVSDSSENLADEFGDLWGALINATFGNAVELIVS